jgi:hypothetical protein
MKKEHGLRFGFAVLVLAAIFAGGCETGGGGGSVTYQTTAGGKTYTLVIYASGNRAAYTPQSGDRYELTINPGNSRSTGTVAASTGTILTLKPANVATSFTVTTTGTEGGGEIKAITGTVTLEDGKTVAGSGLVKPGTGGGGGGGGGSRGGGDNKTGGNTKIDTGDLDPDNGITINPPEEPPKSTGRFVAVGFDPYYRRSDFSYENKVFYSTDKGKTWTEGDRMPHPGTGFVYGDGTFVTLNGGGEVSEGGYSTDGGVTWTEITVPVNFDAIGNSYATYYDIAYGNETFVANGVVGKVIYSTNGGRNWEEASIPMPSNWLRNDLNYGNGKFIVVGDHLGNYNAMSSLDGINWTAFRILDGGSYHVVAYGDGKFVTANYSNAAYSTDGINWTSAAIPTGACGWRDMTYGNGTFVAVGYQIVAFEGDVIPGIIYSTDGGVTWGAANMPNLNGVPLFVTYGDGVFIATGGDSYSDNGGNYYLSSALYSYDGITWNNLTMPNTNYYWRVAYGDYTPKTPN